MTSPSPPKQTKYLFTCPFFLYIPVLIRLDLVVEGVICDVERFWGFGSGSMGGKEASKQARRQACPKGRQSERERHAMSKGQAVSGQNASGHANRIKHPRIQRDPEIKRSNDQKIKSTKHENSRLMYRTRGRRWVGWRVSVGLGSGTREGVWRLRVGWNST